MALLKIIGRNIGSYSGHSVKIYKYFSVVEIFNSKHNIYKISLICSNKYDIFVESNKTPSKKDAWETLISHYGDQIIDCIAENAFRDGASDLKDKIRKLYGI